MAEPFIGEIRMFGGNFAPRGWSFCNGSILSIADNEALFFLLGTTYGGDGQTTFALPDLRGRAPVHQGAQFILGQKAGVEQVTLISNQLPLHSHQATGATVGDATTPLGNFWSTDAGGNVAAYHTTTAGGPDSTMAAAAIGQAGGSQPHENMQPYLAINYIIALFGVFPSQN